MSMLYIFHSFRESPIRIASSTGTKLPVSGIAEAGHNVRMFVEAFIDRPNVNIDLRMRLLHHLDPFRGGDQTDELDALHPPTLKDLRRSGGRAACGEHRIQDETDGNTRLSG